MPADGRRHGRRAAPRWIHRRQRAGGNDMTKPTEPSTGRVRASDTEREQYAQILRTAMSEGRLTMEDGEVRLGQAYGATYRDELDPLIADLPRGVEFRTPEFLADAGRRLRRHRNGVVSVAAIL